MVVIVELGRICVVDGVLSQFDMTLLRIMLNGSNNSNCLRLSSTATILVPYVYNINGILEYGIFFIRIYNSSGII